MPTPHNILKQIESHREQWYQVQQKICAAMTMLLIKGYEFTPTRIDVLFLDDTPIETKIQQIQKLQTYIEQSPDVEYAIPLLDTDTLGVFMK